MLKRIYRKVKRLKSESIKFTLPPKLSRFCTEEWKENSYYFSSALQEVIRLSLICGLNEQSRILDIGCGQGRLAIGLQATFPRLKSYIGIDVHKPSIDWCKKTLVRPNFNFIYIDTINDRYNPSGKKIYKLPIDNNSCDVIYLYSVLTHMKKHEVEKYLKQISIILSNSGKVLLTIYAEDWDVSEESNPDGYLAELGEHQGPLHRVVFDKSAFESICVENGLRCEQFLYRCEEVTKQSVYILTKEEPI